MRRVPRVLRPLLGRNLSSSAFNRLLQSAFTRLLSLKSYRHDRLTEDRNEVTRLLHDNLPKLALSPYCEQMIKHQNLLDVYGMIEGYLNLVKERINLLRHGRELSEELNEAVSSIVFAASRCTDFPELEEIKSIFTSLFGREFVGRVVELRNNNVVHHSIIQKLSTKKPDMKSKMNLLRVIASDNGYAVQLNEKGEISGCFKTNDKVDNKTELTLTKRSYRTRSTNRIRRR